MRKNFTLKTRGILCCCTGVEIVLPCFFLALLCLPKALVEDSRNNDVFAKPYQLATSWDDVECVSGYTLVVSPDSDDAKEIAEKAYVNLVCDAARSRWPDATPYANAFLYQRVFCQDNLQTMSTRDPVALATLGSMFGSALGLSDDDTNGAGSADMDLSALCADACLRDSACYASGIGAVARVFTRVFADADDASAYVSSNPGAALAFVRFKSGVSGSSDDPTGASGVVDYVLTVNATAYGTDVEDAELTRENFARRWGTDADSNYWKKSAHVLRVTNAIESAVIDAKDGGVDFSANVDVSVRPYPWLGYDYNIGGIIAAGVFAIIGTLAFISNVVIIMKSVVVEKELRLREGMQMMGMSSNMYWASWFFTHWITGMCTVVLLVIIGTYPFEYTNPVMQLIFYTLWITSCILWNYMISCAFSRSITASVVGCFVYVMSIAPAIAVRITQPNGGSAWLAVCLLPGSSINQWGDILARLELAKAGITFASAGENVNRDGTFTAWAVIGMTFLDCVLFALATWYLDKTWPKEYGVRLQPWFPFTKKYWFPNAAEFSDVSDASSSDVEESGETFEKLPPEALRNASVKIRGLKKTFDNGVVAVDDLSVTFVPGQVSALLGHNGAGKTTTISMLTGMLDATGGDAFINNRSIKTDMPAIRASLGICPQFDVLWPMMTVREHLTLYAAFGGMRSAETKKAVVDAVAEVALLEKLDVPTGNLSGGQKRKLSLAIAFVTRPDVVFLDEPTSGMDPYSRRFTWEVIRRRAATSSIMLTTHFLDEADLLCDRIAIMSAGKLACVGSPLFLKNRYGTGYTLTLARASSNPNGGADAIMGIVKSHLPGAVVTSDVGAELAVMLPSEGSGKFASLFKELDGAIKNVGFASYGISCTTLEEVFLSIARGGVGGGAASRRMSLDGKKKNARIVDDGDSADGTPLMDDDHDAIAEADEDLRRGYVKGRALLARQARGLLWKRYLNWRRDAWSVLIQIVVPVLFFVLALVLAGLDYSEDTQFAPIDVSRANLLGNTPTVASVDSSDAGVTEVLSRWPETDIQIRPTHAPSLGCECNCPQDDQPPVFFPAECCAYDFEAANVSMHASISGGGFDSEGVGDDDESYASKIFAVYSWCQAVVVPTYPKGAQCAATPRLGMDVAPACVDSADDSFDAYLWQSSEGQGTVCKDQKTVFCDAMRVESYETGTGRYAHELYAHQTAYHSLWATSRSANAAILRARLNDDAADFASRVEWFPKLETYEDGDIVNEPNDSTFITSLFVVMGAAVLTSSVVVFPVYERRNNSKHLQMVSGVDKVVYWLCHWFADLAQMIGPMAAIMIIFAAFDIEQYRGELGGVFVLLFCFVCSSITYTHLLGFYFANEFYAFVGLVGAKMFLGLVSASAGMVVQAIKDLNDDTKIANDVLSKLLPLIIPHYSFGKGLYDIGQNKLNGARMAFDAATMTVRPVGRKDWWDADVVGDDIGFLVGLGVFYGAVILFAEVFEGRVSSLTARLGAFDPYALVSRNDRETARRIREEEDARDAAAEDEDVAAERARVREMAASGFDPTRVGADPTSFSARDARDGVILESLSKTFGGGAKAKRAVRDVSVGMPRGQCFGLLGINGAGKTSTFRMITGEFAPTHGDTKVLSTHGGTREYVSVGAELSRARRAMGYCPQFDGLQPNMTGREHLQFYAQVRGVPDDRVDAVVDALIDKMALRKYCEKQAGTYSGGNKRKLSVAIALVGEPSVVLLDEPSTGMDPEARRFMWDVISASTRGRTIVLTSHSMEECEALCNRIGIMVGGRFSCLGSLQHLKNRFSEGYSIDLRFQPGRGAAVADAVAAANLPGLEIVETHPTELKLRAKQEGTPLWRLFDVVEKLRNAPAPPLAAVVHVSSEPDGDGAPGEDAPNAGGALVDEYSVSQTTLEQVFVRFASKQNEETGAAPGLAFGYQGAMMDDAPPPRRKPGCCFQVCCCGCCCP